MQIRLSQQSLSPLHHFLHSNAFSLLYKIPPYSPTPWLCSFCRKYRRNFRTFPASKEDVHHGDSVLYVLLPGICGDNKKNGRAGRFFFPHSSVYTMNHPPARLSTGGIPSIWRRCRMDSEGKTFFSSTLNFSYSTSPFQPFISTVACVCVCVWRWGEAAPPPITSPSD